MSEFRAPDLPPSRDGEIRRELAEQQRADRKVTFRTIARLALRAIGDGKTRPEWGSETRNEILGILKPVVKEPEAFLRGLTSYHDRETMTRALDDLFMADVLEKVRQAIARGRNPKRRRQAKREAERR